MLNKVTFCSKTLLQNYCECAAHFALGWRGLEIFYIGHIAVIDKFGREVACEAKFSFSKIQRDLKNNIFRKFAYTIKHETSKNNRLKMKILNVFKYFLGLQNGQHCFRPGQGKHIFFIVYFIFSF